MVGGQRDNGVVCKTAGRECLKQLADQAVDIGNIGIIAVAGAADIGLGDLIIVDRGDIIEAAAVRIERIIGNGRHARHVDIVIAVEVPEFLARGIGIVRMGEGHGEAEWRAFAIADMVENSAHGEKRHLVVIFELIGDLGNARLLDGGHVVVPPVDAFLRLRPVRRPAEISRINIGGEPFLESMELVGADEMHFAAQAGTIALKPEVMCEGRYCGREFRGVVINAAVRRQQAAHQRGPCGSTQRARRIGVLEDDPARGKRVDMRGFDEPVPIGRQKRSRQLVGHDEENIGARGFGHI